MMGRGRSHLDPHYIEDSEDNRKDSSMVSAAVTMEMGSLPPLIHSSPISIQSPHHHHHHHREQRAYHMAEQQQLHYRSLGISAGAGLRPHTPSRLPEWCSPTFTQFLTDPGEESSVSSPTSQVASSLPTTHSMRVYPTATTTTIISPNAGLILSTGATCWWAQNVMHPLRRG